MSGSDIISFHGPSGLLGHIRLGVLRGPLDEVPVRPVGGPEKTELLDELVKVVRKKQWLSPTS